MTLDEITKPSLSKCSAKEIEGYIDDDVYESDYLERIEHAKKYDDDETRLKKILNSARAEMMEDSICSVTFGYEGSHDSRDFCNAEIYFPFGFQNSLDINDQNAIKQKWQDFLNGVAEIIENLYASAGYEINDGGGGSAEWTLKENSFEFRSFYRLIETEDVFELNLNNEELPNDKD